MAIRDRQGYVVTVTISFIFEIMIDGSCEKFFSDAAEKSKRQILMCLPFAVDQGFVHLSSQRIIRMRFLVT